MKPLLEDIAVKKGQDSFLIFEIDQSRFDFFWHYHPEYELTLICDGRGRRLVGDNHADFDSGDLVLLGPGIPHTWVSDGKGKGKVSAVVIQFSAHFMERFSSLAELSAIHKLLELSARGISFKGKRLGTVPEQIKRLPQANGLEKITGLLHILQELTRAQQSTLASVHYQPLKGKENENRINRVCQYVQRHATDKLTLQQAAALLHLSPGAFCKFFKRITGQTFTDYVNDIRIANVCRQLLATDKQVAEIAFGNGFETLTYFNRVFLKKTGMRPRQYRMARSY